MSNKTRNSSNATAAMVDDALAAGQDGFDALRRAGAVYLEGYNQIGASYFASATVVAGPIFCYTRNASGRRAEGILC